MEKPQPTLLKTALSTGFVSALLVATLGSTAAMADQHGYNHNGNVYYGENHYKNKGHYNNGRYNNGYYNNAYKNNKYRYKNDGDDVEDRIKQEARYPTIKQRAIRKMNRMGYQVEDIELDEKNNRGVFEIEAKRGGQEYEVILGYPNLNVIKLEKD